VSYILSQCDKFRAANSRMPRHLSPATFVVLPRAHLHSSRVLPPAIAMENKFVNLQLHSQFPQFSLGPENHQKKKKEQRELHLFASLLAFCRRRLLHISFYCHVRSVSLWHTPPSQPISISMDLGAIYRAFTVVSPTRIEHRRLLTIAGCGQGI